MLRFRAFSFSLLVVSAIFGATSLQASASAGGHAAILDSKHSTLLRKSYNQMVDGDFRDAVDTQVLAVKADRNSVNARRYLSYSLLKIGASDEAIEQLHHLLSMTRATPVDMCMCGEANLQAGRLEHAELWFKEALMKDPSMNSARVGLSNVAAKKKVIASAKVSAPVQTVESLDKEPEEPKTTFELGQVQGEGGEAYAAIASVAQGTHSLASETARQLRNSTANQQVATAVPGRGAKSAAGNNQVLNAWQGFKGVQKR